MGDSDKEKDSVTTAGFTNMMKQRVRQRTQEWMQESENINPDDSASVVASKDDSRESKSHCSRSSRGSSRSSVSSTRVKLAAKRAGLEAERAAIRERQCLEQEEFLLIQKKEQLELKVQIAKTEAQEKAYAYAQGDTMNIGQDTLSQAMDSTVKPKQVNGGNDVESCFNVVNVSTVTVSDNVNVQSAPLYTHVNKVTHPQPSVHFHPSPVQVRMTPRLVNSSPMLVTPSKEHQLPKPIATSTPAGHVPTCGISDANMGYRSSGENQYVRCNIGDGGHVTGSVQGCAGMVMEGDVQRPVTTTKVQPSIIDNVSTQQIGSPNVTTNDVILQVLPAESVPTTGTT